MEAQFVDRILTCVDCRNEFVFTAGEQLFFFDKQFKNDPKRCKPCKSRRSGLSAAANGATGPAAAGISRTETRTECSECGVQTTVPFKPTQGRPVLCRQCFQQKAKMAAVSAGPAASAPTEGHGAGPSSVAPAALVTPVAPPAPVLATLLTGTPVAEPTTAETITALTAASANELGQVLSPEAAQVAAASMAAASPASSVATVADLASILETAQETPAMAAASGPGKRPVSVRLVAAAARAEAGNGAAPLLAAEAEPAE